VVVADTWQELDDTLVDEVVVAGAAVVAEDAVVAEVELAAVEDTEATAQLEEQVVAATLAETAFAGADSELGNCTTTPTLMELPAGKRPW